MGASISTQDRNGVWEVTFVDSKILDEVRITQMGTELRQVDEQCNYRLFLNFKGVQFISSALIGHLCLLHGRIKKYRNTALVVCNVAANVLEVFKLVRGLDNIRLIKTFTFVDTSEQALAQLQSEITQIPEPT